MPVRIRITIFFAAIVFCILCLVCSSIYYFSYANRQENFNIRLLNRAVTTARLLEQPDLFNREQVRQIDSATAAAMDNKSIQAFDQQNRRVYAYADRQQDIIAIDAKTLAEARQKKFVWFSVDNKDAIAYYYVEPGNKVVIVAAAYDKVGESNLHQLQVILWIFFVVGMCVAVVGGYFFSISLLRPIRRIADEVNEISIQNLSRRMRIGKSNDEWAYLTRTLNQLLNRLEESFATQGRFISNASHELSTPLTSISSQLEVALQKERSAGEYKGVMQSILQDVRHLGRLTQTLLQFAKASGTVGGLEINLVRVDEILMRMPREMSNLGNGFSVQLSFDDLPEEEERLLVFGNEDLLFSAIRNIILNACKYSGDHVAMVGLTVKEDEIVVQVKDEGKGIPEDALQSIFQPFFRVDDLQEEAGFGLGLSLAGRIIKLHKGRIDIKSQVDKGTEITIFIPVAGAGRMASHSS